MIEFVTPYTKTVVIALRDGKPIAKASMYYARGTWLVQSMGSGLDLGGTYGHPGVKAFKSLAAAKKAIIAAAPLGGQIK